MSISTNSQFKSKTINIQNQEGTKGVFLYYDSVLENLITTNVNPDPSYIPTSQDFVFDYSNKTEFYAGESMTSIHIYFDGLIGSNTTVLRMVRYQQYLLEQATISSLTFSVHQLQIS